MKATLQSRILIMKDLLSVLIMKDILQSTTNQQVLNTYRNIRYFNKLLNTPINRLNDTDIEHINHLETLGA